MKYVVSAFLLLIASAALKMDSTGHSVVDDHQSVTDSLRQRTLSTSSTETGFSTFMDSSATSSSGQQLLMNGSSILIESSEPWNDDLEQSSSEDKRPRRPSSASTSNYFTAMAESITSPFSKPVDPERKKSEPSDSKATCDDNLYRSRFDSFATSSGSLSSASDSSSRSASHHTGMSSHEGYTFQPSRFGTSLMYDMMFGGQGEFGLEHRALFKAVEEGNVVVVSHLLVHQDFTNVKINRRNNAGVTVLNLASTQGHVEIFEKLLRVKNLDVNQKSSDGTAPWNAAFNNGHESILEKLLLTGQNIKNINDRDKSGKTVLIWASTEGHSELVRKLLEAENIEVNKDIVNTTWNSGATPLYMASEKGHVAIVRMLLDSASINVNKPDRYGSTPLAKACYKGHTEVIRLLIDTGKINVNESNRVSETPLFVAAQNDRAEVVRILLDTTNVIVNIPDSVDTTPLYIASEKGYAEVVRILLSAKDIDINASKSGQSPYSKAQENVQHTEGCKEIVKLLENYEIETASLRSNDSGYASDLCNDFFSKKDIGDFVDDKLANELFFPEAERGLQNVFAIHLDRHDPLPHPAVKSRALQKFIEYHLKQFEQERVDLRKTRSALKIFQTYIMALKPNLDMDSDFDSNEYPNTSRLTFVDAVKSSPITTYVASHETIFMQSHEAIFMCIFKITAGELNYLDDSGKLEHLSFEEDFEFSLPFAYETKKTIGDDGLPLVQVSNSLHRLFPVVERIKPAYGTVYSRLDVRQKVNAFMSSIHLQLKCWRVPKFEEIRRMYKNPDPEQMRPGLIANVEAGTNVEDFTFLLWPYDHEEEHFWNDFKAMALTYEELRHAVKFMTGQALPPVLKKPNVKAAAEENCPVQIKDMFGDAWEPLNGAWGTTGRKIYGGEYPTLLVTLDKPFFHPQKQALVRSIPVAEQFLERREWADSNAHELDADQEALLKAKQQELEQAKDDNNKVRVDMIEGEIARLKISFFRTAKPRADISLLEKTSVEDALNKQLLNIYKVNYESELKEKDQEKKLLAKTAESSSGSIRASFQKFLAPGRSEIF